MNTPVEQEDESLPQSEQSQQNTPEEQSDYLLKKQQEIEKLTAEIEAKRALNTKKELRNWWIKTGLILLLCAFSVGIMLTLGDSIMGGGQVSFIQMITNIRWPFFGALLGAVLLDILLESAKYSYLLKISTGKWQVRTSSKTMFLGRYYDGITPFATGGQPFQIYYLHKKKIPAGTANSIPLVRFIIYTIVWCAFSLVMLAIAPHFLAKSEAANALTTTIMVIAWVAVGVNLFVPVAVVIVSLFPSAGKKFIVWIVWLLHKMRIVKRKYKTNRKLVYEIQEYCNSIKTLCQRWWKLIPLILITLLEVIVYTALPFFTILALADIQPTYELLLQILCLNIISQASANLIPTPGNSGALETTTSLVFITVSGINQIIGWAILVWRFLTYYLYILTGIGINIFDIIRSAIRNRRAQKRQQNQTE